MKQTIKQAFRIVVSTMVCLGICSCSLLASGKKEVKIDTDDPRSIIYVDGEEVGQGSAVVQLNKDQGHFISAENGSKRGHAKLDSALAPVGILDLVGTLFFLVPVVGLLTKGAYDLDRDAVQIHLR